MSVEPSSSPTKGSVGPEDDASEFERAIWSNLDEIPDPHLPISLVEMAMIYDVNVDRRPDGRAVTVEMTFPCMGCPAYDMIIDDIEACLRSMEGIDSVDVEVVWDPVWSKDMLSEDVRGKLTDSGIGL